MDTPNRIQEAIKQTDIAIREVSQPDVRRELEQARENLREALESVDEHVD
jgi:hypothetical protein